MMKTNKILLIEDRVDFAKSFAQTCKGHSIEVVHEISFNGLKKLLPHYEHNLAAVVLDIRCLIHDEQEKEDPGFITVALKYLYQNCPLFPRYILTGDDMEFDRFKDYFKEEKVFLKTSGDIKELIRELVDCVENSEIFRLKRQYPDVFKLCEDGKINNHSQKLLIDLLSADLDALPFSGYKAVLTTIRSMQELIYKSINQRNAAVVPNHMFKANGMVEFNKLMKYLQGNPDSSFRPTTTVYQNNTISHLAGYLYRTCGEYIHEQLNRDYYISRYTMHSLRQALLELILWSGRY